jgi:hypothetical protein
MKTNPIIFDFETLGTDVNKCVVLCMGILQFDDTRLNSNNPYTYEELLNLGVLIKFDVSLQVNKYGRKIDPQSVDWWSEQSKESRKILTPTKSDVSIDTLHGILCAYDQPRKIYTRGSNFDPLILDSLMLDTKKSNPFDWWNFRDTRSLIEGLSYGSGLKHNYIPEELEGKIVAHNPIHDIALDVIRIQQLARLML